jgi:hypothetical protein
LWFRVIVDTSVHQMTQVQTIPQSGPSVQILLQISPTLLSQSVIAFAETL